MHTNKLEPVQRLVAALLLLYYPVHVHPDVQTCRRTDYNNQTEKHFRVLFFSLWAVTGIRVRAVPTTYYPIYIDAHPP